MSDDSSASPPSTPGAGPPADSSPAPDDDLALDPGLAPAQAPAQAPADGNRPHAIPLGARFAALFEVVLCSSIPTQVAITLALSAIGWRPIEEDGGLSFRFVVALSLADTALLIGLMAALLRARGERPSTLWLGARPPWREARLGLLSIPGIFVVVVLLLNALRVLAPGLRSPDGNPLEQMLPGEAGSVALFGLVVILAGGVREELQRAFLLHRVEQYLGGTTVGVVVLSVAFGLGHFVQGWDAVLTTGLLGMTWAIVYVRRRSSVGPVVSHAGFNALEVLRVSLMGQ
ncbi:MAG: CPBP family intramembrane glutamic endopeptidase [Vicinamibacterales bacterium]